uniref:Uncharacterized protein n=1 Tax=Anopheles dirus TaxID=7168 RepID=A0A182NYV2_9DIPT
MAILPRLHLCHYESGTRCLVSASHIEYVLPCRTLNSLHKSLSTIARFYTIGSTTFLNN